MKRGRVVGILQGKNFLKLLDFTGEEVNYLLELSAEVKREKAQGIFKKRLKNKNIALIFEKDSTRTRCSFEVAANDEGATATYLGSSGSQVGKKESIKDTARVLGRLYDGIQFRGYEQEAVETLGEFSGVPVWNGLTDDFHPTQILADLLTIKEEFGRFEGIKMAYLGDGRNNMANSLLVGSALVGMNMTVVAPEEYYPKRELQIKANEIAKKTGSRIEFTSSLEEGVKGAHVIYTDVWVSMGEDEKVWENRIEKLLPYQVNSELMEKAGGESIFLHCLPSFHNLETDVGRSIFERYGLEEMEVTDKVFEGERSRVFDQAENRLHTIKAIMIATMGG